MVTFPKKPTHAISSLTSKELTQQGVFLSRLGRLLQDGFSLKEALTFLETIADKKSKPIVQGIKDEASLGVEFSTVLKQAGFPDYTCSQVYFSLFHGRFSEAVTHAGDHLLKQAEKKKKLLGILQYPVMLLVFITLMLFAMRYILLPHIEQIVSVDATDMPLSTRLIVQGVYQAPIILVGLTVAFIVTLVGFKIFFRKKSPLERLSLVSRLTRSTLYQLYWSQFFSYEWGSLLRGECSLLEVVDIMKGNATSPLINEMGHWIEQKMRGGELFHEALEPLKFLKSEVIEVVKHGEITGKLGKELEMYAKNCEEEFDKKIEKAMERIQPVIFIFVAVIIIAIYAALLLPTFSLMDTL